MHWIRSSSLICIRLHTQDISYLLDICRQTIIFEDPSSLVECMRIISRDTETRIIRIKNRLDPAFNSVRSAGYRDVALNIKLANEETLGMGLENHVCEVQLILLPIYQLKVSYPAECMISTPSEICSKKPLWDWACIACSQHCS